MPTSDFELRLIDALQPVRGLALAHGVLHLFRTGIHDELAAGARDVAELAAATSCEPVRLVGFLQYLANEGLVVLDDPAAGAVALTTRGRDLAEFRPWYELLVGGYADTFSQITTTLRTGGYATRDGRMVGIGSCGISRYDALPLARRLLSDLPAGPGEVVDLGCGDGRFLAELLASQPGATGIGVDPYAPDDGGPGEPAFRRASATAFMADPANLPGDRSGRLVLAAFLLQEILEQEGRPAVVRLLRQALAAAEHVLVIEVDHRPDDPAVMRHGLGLGYYNPYYLLHVLTEQQLRDRGFWAELFDEAGAVVLAQQTVDAAVDSTGLEFGCLLSAGADR